MNGQKETSIDLESRDESSRTISDHMASLRYAVMIQRALMPGDETISAFLKEYFLVFYPRDIVSGDFYYVQANKGHLFIAAGDCTGHGVPGALMSILGISFLNEIVQSSLHTKPNRILNLMREKVMKALRQTGEKAETKDSIDIALCVIDQATGKMEYAGANRPLILMRAGAMTEYKPDFMTIGLDNVREKSFSSCSIELQKDDMLYLFSDGFPDQFGGPEGKKLKLREFKKLIESVAALPVGIQKEKLESAFNRWKGNNEQVDDVMVLGFRL